MKCLLTLVFGLLVCSSILGQDLGEEKPNQPEIDEGEQFTDPYKLSIKVRPLSYLLVIPTAGSMGSFNGRIDYAFSRKLSVGVEGNLFYERPNAFLGSINSSTMLSARLDFNYFFINKAPMSSYAEGFHLGPYFKAKFENSFNPDLFIPRYGQSQVTCILAAVGPLIGYQWVFNNVVIDQSFGIGAGPYINDVEIGIVFDARLGLSFGLVAF